MIQLILNTINEYEESIRLKEMIVVDMYNSCEKYHYNGNIYLHKNKECYILIHNNPNVIYLDYLTIWGPSRIDNMNYPQIQEFLNKSLFKHLNISGFEITYSSNLNSNSSYKGGIMPLDVENLLIPIFK
jgi:hypothetical protein